MKSNEDGSVGVLYFFILLVLFVGFFYLLFGGMIDGYFDAAKSIAASDPSTVSPERNTAMNQIGYMWWGFPILVLLVLAGFAIKSALRERSGDVL